MFEIVSSILKAQIFDHLNLQLKIFPKNWSLQIINKLSEIILSWSTCSHHPNQCWYRFLIPCKRIWTWRLLFHWHRKCFGNHQCRLGQSFQELPQGRACPAISSHLEDSRLQAGKRLFQSFWVGPYLNPIGVFRYIGAMLDIPSQIGFEVGVCNVLKNRQFVEIWARTWSEQLFQVHGGIRLYSGQSMKQ